MKSVAPLHAFRLDSRTCAGCKACQIACKDKHGLEVGRLWRRVYEVAGGGWRREGQAWVSDVFAFHLSVSCNHCRKPICVEVCPSRALSQRDDGLVLLDTDRCLGCSYCEWACPYGAPQYDEARGCMTKCTFCVDELDAGREPVCVTACPLRVLEHAEGVVPALAGDPVAPADLARTPLPDARLTEPSLLLTEHRDAPRAREEEIEVLPRQRHELHEWSLVAFTLLCHLAAGSVLYVEVLAALGSGTGLPAGSSGAVRGLSALTVLVALGLSLRHLGSPLRAPWALANLRSSWLSREILAAVLFAATCTAAWLQDAGDAGLAAPVLRGLTGLLALTLVLVISGVYRLRTVAPWNTPLTLLAFLATSLALGGLAVTAACSWRPEATPPVWPLLAVLVARTLVSALAASRTVASEPAGARRSWTYLPTLLLASSALSVALGPVEGSARWTSALLLLAAGEVLARHRFFKTYRRSGL